MEYHAIVIGAGASGVMCASQAYSENKRILLLDNGKDTLRKVFISGGGRCNVTNINTRNDKYISANNIKFVNHALKSYTHNDILEFLKSHNIAYHEKHKGQIFCTNGSRDLVEALESTIDNDHVDVLLEKEVISIGKNDSDDLFIVKTHTDEYQAKNVVIATGGASIPKMGATMFGYDVAKEFDIDVEKIHPSLVPFIFEQDLLDSTYDLKGVSLEVSIKCGKKKIIEDLLFTHQGISGPAALQISNYWNMGERLVINFLPHDDIKELIQKEKSNNPKRLVKTILNYKLPKSFVSWLCEQTNTQNIQLANLSNKDLNKLVLLIHQWGVIPRDTKGYQIAEVTKGGVSTKELNPMTFETNKVKGLYFIGEVIDVTGMLGGYNLQWAWATGYVCGTHIK